MLSEHSSNPVILVLGVSNSGKSTLVNWMLDGAAKTYGRNALNTVTVRDTLQSTTNDVQEVAFSYKSSSGVAHEVVLVDTPGFDHSSLTNKEVVQRIAEWFNSRNRQANQPLSVSSILYCHDISSDFVNPTMRLDLEVLSKLCGPKAMSLVCFTTLKWDQLNRSVLGEVREAELERRFWARSMDGEPCAVKRVKDQHDAMCLLAMVIERTEKLTEPPPLQIQLDLEESGGDWSNTQAARGLDPPKKQKRSNKALRSWWRALYAPAPSNTLIASLADNEETKEWIDPVLEEGRESDLVFLIMGEVHSGKSTFLRMLTGAESIEVGTKLTPCTKQVMGIIGMEDKREIAGHRLIFVDTPGLDGSTSTLRRIANWLQKSHERRMGIGGVIFLHDITRAELPSSSKQNLRIFSKMCGDCAMKRVALVTTKWDRISIEEGRGRIDELNTVWEAMLRLGASSYHLHADNSDSNGPPSGFKKGPADVIEDIISKAGDVYPSLRIQEEMAVECRPLWETAAGREVPNLLEQEKHLRQHRIFR